MQGSQEEDPAESGKVPRKYVFFGPHVGVLCPLSPPRILATSPERHRHGRRRDGGIQCNYRSSYTRNSYYDANV